VPSSPTASQTASPTALGKERLFAELDRLLPVIRERGREVEEHGGLPDELRAAFREAGFFAMSFPERLGGAGLGFLDRISFFQTMAAASPSTAWVVGLLAYGGLLAQAVPADVADELFPDPDVAMVFARGEARASRVEGGVVVDGTFGWVSGARDADGVNLRAPLFDAAGEPVLRPDGTQVLCGAFFTSMEQFEIIDTWKDAEGMRGSGTVTVIARDAFVADRHWVDMRVDGENPDYSGPLGRYPMLLFLQGNATLLGATEAILDEVERQLREKRSSSGVPVLTLTHVSRELMHARGLFQAASAMTYDLARELDELVFSGRPVSDERMSAAARALVIGAELCRRAADEALPLTGSAHVFRSNPLNRLYADLRVGASHVIHRRDFLDRAAQLWQRHRSQEAG
jgi:alkylation response protein AidB-like acyl-CoA dehydrogenase